METNREAANKKHNPSRLKTPIAASIHAVRVDAIPTTAVTTDSRNTGKDAHAPNAPTTTNRPATKQNESKAETLAMGTHAAGDDGGLLKRSKVSQLSFRLPFGLEQAGHLAVSLCAR